MVILMWNLAVSLPSDRFYTSRLVCLSASRDSFPLCSVRYLEPFIKLFSRLSTLGQINELYIVSKWILKQQTSSNVETPLQLQAPICENGIKYIQLSVVVL